MAIDSMENELDYPDPYKDCRPLSDVSVADNNKEITDNDFCPNCGKVVKFDNYGAYCTCGYKEQL